MNSRRKYFPMIAAVVQVCIIFPASAQDAGAPDETTIKKAFARPYSPYAQRNFPTRPFFGDTHLHTANSLDAATAGNRVGPEDAFRFARGEEVTASSGQRARLSRPLDFLVVTDHAEGYGAITELLNGNPLLLADPTVKRWYDMIRSGGDGAVDVVNEMRLAVGADTIPEVLVGPKLARSVWERHVAIADQFNDPGQFTAFVGFEWTSMPGGNNLHRVIIFRDAKELAVQTLPFSAYESEDPEDLWKWMATYEAKTGGQMLAIPHNGNLSNGGMFAMADFLGKPLTRQYADARMRWEPLLEVTQIKGDGETHPFLSPNDEFADYERWDKGNGSLQVLKKQEMLKYEYARSGLQLGLEMERKLGSNPFKFGMVGGTDSHTSLTAIEENNFFGKATPFEPSADRINVVYDENGEIRNMGSDLTASGLAAVWAAENSRAAIFDAMQRKETYATTGPRIIVRFFGGFDFAPADAQTRNPAEAGYAKGIPMGGDLRGAPDGKSPSFLVAALKDPIGANLDRIQIIKGWLDTKDAVQERVYDVVWGDAGSRKPGPDGKLPPVGNTVDVKNAIWTNTIGASELITVWADPEFDPAQRAFYYARVIEIPTPRWTAYDAKYFGVEMPAEVPMTLQERAYTSPIWYTP